MNQGLRTQAVLIDLDGTLVDSVAPLRQVYFEFLASHGKEGAEEEFDELTGPSLAEIINQLCDRYKLEAPPSDLFDQYMSLLRKCYCERIVPKPGAQSLLTWLRSCSLTTALVTSAVGPLVQDFLPAHDWSPFFSHVFTGDMVAQSKPSPDIYLAALKELGINCDVALSIEDSPNGVRSAKAAGVTVVGVSADDGQRLSAAGAVVVAADLYEVRRLLEAEPFNLQ